MTTADLDTRDEVVSGRPLVSLGGLALAAHGVRRSPPARALTNVVIVALALSAVVWLYFDVRWGVHNRAMAFDFRGTLWDPGTAILDGRSPYPTARLSEVDIGNPAYYPPLLMLLVAPMTFLPWSVGALLWTALLVTAVLGTLHVLDVQDRRCYALALVSAPVVTGVLWGNATLLLVFAVALAWRWRRNHPYRCAALIGVGIAVKLLLWPLLLWLLGTKRYRAAMLSGAIATIGLLVPWAVIGFDGFLTYPDLLRTAQDIYALHGLSAATMLGALGLGAQAATWVGLAAGTVVAMIAFVVGRKGRDEGSISLAVFAALLASPIVWEHYYALLLVPLAIARPRFSALWMTLPLFRIALSLPAPKLEAAAIEPGGVACCPPDGMPRSAWLWSHSPPALWPALGHAVLAGLVCAAAWVIARSARTTEIRPTRE